MSELHNVGDSLPPHHSIQGEQQPPARTAEGVTLDNEGATSIANNNRASSSAKSDENERSDSGLIFITGGQPEDFRTRKVMTTVRKKAMDAWLRGDGKPTKTSDSAQSQQAKVDNSRSLESDSGYDSKLDKKRAIPMSPRGGDAFQETQQQKSKPDRKPMNIVHASSEERKRRNIQAQAAFRERRTEYIKQLESTIKHHEETLKNLQNSHRNSADECLMLRYKVSLLEKVLLEKGVDVVSELRARTGSPILEPNQPVAPDLYRSPIPLQDAREETCSPDSEATQDTASGHHETLIALHDEWTGIPMLPSISALVLLLSRLTQSKFEEAMALFEAVVLTCPVDTRTQLLISILEHVETDLPLERWWTTAGTGDAHDQDNDAFKRLTSSLEGKWHLEHEGSRMDEADEAYEQIKELFYASRTKLDEAMAFFETIAGACDEDKRATLLYDVLQQVKTGVSPEQWWASVNEQHAGRDVSERLGPMTAHKKPTTSRPRMEDSSDMDSGSLVFSKKHMMYFRKKSYLSDDGRVLPQYTPYRKSISAAAPSGGHNRDSGYFSERDASVSRFATPQTLPSLTERSTISPQRWLSPWTPIESESTALSTVPTLAPSHMEAIMEIDDEGEPGKKADLPLGHQPGRKLSSKYKNSDGSAMSRRKIQNMLAQQAFFARKKRLEEAKGEEQQISEVEEVVPEAEPDTTNVNMSQEVLMYQLPGEQVLIQCVCGNINDGRFIIPCITCGKWQHIRCYYQLAQDVVENHECVLCDPRELNGQGKVQAKRPAEEDPAWDVASTATQSAKRPKTVGAESSLVPSIKPLPGYDHSNMLASKSNHQNILSETSSFLGYSYPTSTATTLSKSKLQRGCLACRERHLKCDESKPKCDNCAKSKRECSWGLKLTFLDTTSERSAYLIPRGDDYLIDFQDESRSIAAEYVSSHDMSPHLVDDDDIHYQIHIESKHDADDYMTTLIQPATPQASHHRQHLSPVDDMVPGDLHPQELSTDLTSKRGSHKIAEQGRRNRINTALQEIKTLLPSKQITSAETAGDADNSKAATVESAVEYIKELQQQVREKVRLLGEQDRQIERLWAVDSGVTQNDNDAPQNLLDDDAIQALHGGINSNIEDEEDENSSSYELPDATPEANVFVDCKADLETDWTVVQAKLPESWKWDVEYQPFFWTCTPLELDEPKHYPLTIAGAPVVLPVEHQWPPIGGVNPPPDPRPSVPLDCTTSMPLETVRDLFLTFEKSIGFYLLISGLLQIIVPDDFDTAWASSHLPHKYGGLKVCYIPQTVEATMLPSATETTKSRPLLNTQNTGLSSLFRQSRQSTASSNPALRLNDFIEARPKANHRKEKYAGRIGLKVLKAGEPYLVMSTHIITEAMLAKSHRETFFGRSRDRFDKLDDDWNDHVDIWAGNDRIGTIEKTFDKEAEVYPNGFHHDITLVKPSTPTSVKDIASPLSDLGWLSRDSWNSLRQQSSAVKILGPTEDHRSAKSIKCSRPSEILVVGEGIFLNQTASAGSSKSLKDHDMSTWKNLVSRALLYRVHPDFDPPNGHSGVALYADGRREDGSHGPGIVGFQSFVQRSGHVQNFNMEGPALEKRLQMGRIAFYGAFEVPGELRREYTIA